MLVVYSITTNYKRSAKSAKKGVQKMLYSEFVNGTGCRQNEANYKVYKRIEEIYNNTPDMTHEEAYKLAMGLIDNTLTEEEKQRNEDTKEEILTLRELIIEQKNELKEYKEKIYELKNAIAYNKEAIKTLKASLIK